MIWSGQLHYSIESFYNFSVVSNISILMEGWSAIILNAYVVYLHCNMFKSNATSESSEGSTDGDEREQLVGHGGLDDMTR